MLATFLHVPMLALMAATVILALAKPALLAKALAPGLIFVPRSLAVLGVVVAAVAAAATGVIDLSPVVNQVIVPVLASVLIAVVIWAVQRAGAFFHFTISDGQRQLVSTAVDNAIAYAQTTLAPKEKITTTDIVAEAVNYLLPKIPDTLKALGITPDHLADLVTAKLGAQPVLVAGVATLAPSAPAATA